MVAALLLTSAAWIAICVMMRIREDKEKVERAGNTMEALEKAWEENKKLRDESHELRNELSEFKRRIKHLEVTFIEDKEAVAQMTEETEQKMMMERGAFHLSKIMGENMNAEYLHEDEEYVWYGASIDVIPPEVAE